MATFMACQVTGRNELFHSWSPYCTKAKSEREKEEELYRGEKRKNDRKQSKHFAQIMCTKIAQCKRKFGYSIRF